MSDGTQEGPVLEAIDTAIDAVSALLKVDRAAIRAEQAAEIERLRVQVAALKANQCVDPIIYPSGSMHCGEVAKVTEEKLALRAELRKLRASARKLAEAAWIEGHGWCCDLELIPTVLQRDVDALMAEHFGEEQDDE